MKRRDFLKGTTQAAVGVAAVSIVGLPESANSVPQQVWTAQHIKVAPVIDYVGPSKHQLALVRELQEMKERVAADVLNRAFIAGRSNDQLSNP